MAEDTYRQISLDGLWRNNPALVQLLGLCPLLAISDSVVRALGLGLATLGIITASSAAVALVRQSLVPETRLIVFSMIIAALVTGIDLTMQAFAFELHQALGIYLPLIATNCVILCRAETFASRNGLPAATLDGLMMGVGTLAVMLVLGGLREIVGTGALFADMQILFGESARHWQLELFSTEQPFLLALLPPGAFIFMGLLIALKNLIDSHLHSPGSPSTTPAPRRVRITGEIR